MNRKSAWIVLAVAVLISLPTRLYQIFFLADRNTGFYTDGGTTTGIISICFTVGVVLIVIMCIMDKQDSKVYHPIRNIPAAVLTVLAGLGLVIESLVSLGTSSLEPNYFMYMILSLFGILAGAVLILTAYDFAVGQNHFSRFPLLALMPTLWGCVCLVALFITCVPVVNVSENIYDAFTVIFLLLFLFSQAKMLSGVENVKSGRLVYIFGIPAIFLTLVTGVSGSAMLFAGVEQAGTFPSGLHLVNFLMALYIFSFLLALHRLPDAQQLDSKEPVEVKAVPEEKPGQSPSLIDWENCWEFLTKEYKSEEKFVERASGPFCRSKN